MTKLMRVSLRLAARERTLPKSARSQDRPVAPNRVTGRALAAAAAFKTAAA